MWRRGLWDSELGRGPPAVWGWGVGVRMKVGLAVWLRAPVGKWLVLVPRLRGGSSPHGSGRARGPQLPRDQVRAEQGCDRGSACRRLARVTPLQGPEASFTALLHFRWHALWLQSIPCPPLPASSLGGQQRSGSCLEGEGAVLAAGRMALRGRGAGVEDRPCSGRGEGSWGGDTVTHL